MTRVCRARKSQLMCSKSFHSSSTFRGVANIDSDNLMKICFMNASDSKKLAVFPCAKAIVS